MSASTTGLGSNKKGGRVSDASAVTAQRRIIVQGQADSTYSTIQKKNGFRTSKSVLNAEQYNSSVLVAQNLGVAAPGVPCPSITLADIATYDAGMSLWIINADTTILECQTLTIPNTYTFFINSATLTNNGTIVIEFGGIIGCNNTFTNNGTFNNNGAFYSFTDGIINNNETINNNGSFSTYDGGMNNNNGTINNNGAFYSFTDGIINNNETINNNGSFYIATNGNVNNNNIINNTGIIYVYDMGNINGNGTINNSGTIVVADGTGACGSGSIDVSVNVFPNRSTPGYTTGCPS
jgi:hypothetical protein